LREKPPAELSPTAPATAQSGARGLAGTGRSGAAYRAGAPQFPREIFD